MYCVSFSQSNFDLAPQQLISCRQNSHSVKHKLILCCFLIPRDVYFFFIPLRFLWLYYIIKNSYGIDGARLAKIMRAVLLFFPCFSATLAHTNLRGLQAPVPNEDLLHVPFSSLLLLDLAKVSVVEALHLHFEGGRNVRYKYQPDRQNILSVSVVCQRRFNNARQLQPVHEL